MEYNQKSILKGIQVKEKRWILPILISTHPSLKNAPFISGEDAGSSLSVAYSNLIPNLNVTSASILTAEDGALVNNGEISIDFTVDEQNVGES